MIEGRIKKIDAENRMAVITTQADEELTLTFPENANIEVAEPETMGTMGGELHDLREGFTVELEIAEREQNGTCRCLSLICVS